MSEGYFGGYDMSRFDFVGFNELASTIMPGSAQCSG